MELKFTALVFFVYITCINGKKDVRAEVKVTSNVTIGDSNDKGNNTTNRTRESLTTKKNQTGGDLKTRQSNSINYKNQNYFAQIENNRSKSSRYELDQNKQLQLGAQDSNNNIVYSNGASHQSHRSQYEEVNKRDKTVRYSEKYRKHLEDLYGIKGVRERGYESNSQSQASRFDSLNTNIHSRDTLETEEILSNTDVFGKMHKRGNQQGNTIGSTNNQVQTGQTQDSITNTREDYKNMFESSETMRKYWEQINKGRITKQQGSERENNNVNFQPSKLLPSNENENSYFQEQKKSHDTSSNSRHETSEERELWKTLQNNEDGKSYKHKTANFENNNPPIKRQPPNGYLDTNNYDKESYFQGKKESHDTQYVSSEEKKLWETMHNNKEGTFNKNPNTNFENSNPSIKRPPPNGYLDTNNYDKESHFQEKKESHDTQYVSSEEKKLWQTMQNNKEGTFNKNPNTNFENSNPSIKRPPPNGYLDTNNYDKESHFQEKKESHDTQYESSEEKRLLETIQNNKEGTFNKNPNTNFENNNPSIKRPPPNGYLDTNNYDKESHFQEKQQSHDTQYVSSEEKKLWETMHNNKEGTFNKNPNTNFENSNPSIKRPPPNGYLDTNNYDKESHFQEKQQSHDTQYVSSEEKKLWETMHNNKEGTFNKNPNTNFENSNPSIKRPLPNGYLDTNNYDKESHFQEKKQSHDTQYESSEEKRLLETIQNNKDREFYKYPSPNIPPSYANNNNRESHFQEQKQSHQTSETQHQTTKEHQIWEIMHNDKKGSFNKHPCPTIENTKTQPIFHKPPIFLETGNHKIQKSHFQQKNQDQQSSSETQQEISNEQRHWVLPNYEHGKINNEPVTNRPSGIFSDKENYMQSKFQQQNQAQQSSSETQQEISNDERFWKLTNSNNNNNEGKYVLQPHINDNINDRFHEQKQSRQEKSESWDATSKDRRRWESTNNNNFKNNNMKHQSKFLNGLDRNTFGSENHNLKNQLTFNQQKSNTEISNSEGISEYLSNKLNHISQNNRGEASAAVQKIENESSNNIFNTNTNNINSDAKKLGREFTNVINDFESKNIFNTHNRNKFMTNTTNTTSTVSGFDRYSEEYNIWSKMQRKGKKDTNCTGKCKNDKNLLKNFRRFKTHLRETYL